jgi:hypothetical protein
MNCGSIKKEMKTLDKKFLDLDNGLYFIMAFQWDSFLYSRLYYSHQFPLYFNMTVEIEEQLNEIFNK